MLKIILCILMGLSAASVSFAEDGAEKGFWQIIKDLRKDNKADWQDNKSENREDWQELKTVNSFLKSITDLEINA